ncbi:hypothetical protein EYF80_016005 [Liparis tanakae]|uniref:Uncharacterized protein n=1 Tax=Liparis tanakae TaxID=230148 RepID=A0A4Z2I6X8_9TELE|nr:hypothetical protein EYF80_016005 [Liparis tanakae]
MGKMQEDLQHQAVRQDWDTLHPNILAAPCRSVDSFLLWLLKEGQDKRITIPVSSTMVGMWCTRGIWWWDMAVICGGGGDTLDNASAACAAGLCRALFWCALRPASCERTWFRRVDDWLKRRLQKRQTNGLSRVWMRMWERRLLRELKPRWQMTQRIRPAVIVGAGGEQEEGPSQEWGSSGRGNNKEGDEIKFVSDGCCRSDVFFIYSRNSRDSQERVVGVSIPNKKLLVWRDSLRKEGIRHDESTCSGDRTLPVKGPISVPALIQVFEKMPRPSPGMEL